MIKEEFVGSLSSVKPLYFHICVPAFDGSMFVDTCELLFEVTINMYTFDGSMTPNDRMEYFSLHKKVSNCVALSCDGARKHWLLIT